MSKSPYIPIKDSDLYIAFVQDGSPGEKWEVYVPGMLGDNFGNITSGFTKAMGKVWGDGFYHCKWIDRDKRLYSLEVFKNAVRQEGYEEIKPSETLWNEVWKVLS